ncbi:13842_t:CDS:2, partial [Dentiscutata heterogama]
IAVVKGTIGLSANDTINGELVGIKTFAENPRTVVVIAVMKGTIRLSADDTINGELVGIKTFAENPQHSGHVKALSG